MKKIKVYENEIFEIEIIDSPLTGGIKQKVSIRVDYNEYSADKDIKPVAQLRIDFI
jgi:hypothetical protein